MADDREGGSLPPHIVPDFLLWLWSRESETFHLGDQPCKAWTEGRLLLQDPTDKREKSTIVGGNPGSRREACTAVLAGMVPVEIRMVIKLDDETQFPVTLRGPLLDFASLRVGDDLQAEPGVHDAEAWEANLLLRLGGHDRVLQALRELFRQFTEERIDPLRWASRAARIATWLVETGQGTDDHELSTLFEEE
jgi:hypothetical protein